MRNALFVGLAEKLYGFAQEQGPTPGPAGAGKRRAPMGWRGQRSGELRPECPIRLRRTGREVERVRAIDIHPTVMHILGLEPGRPVDGRVERSLLRAAESPPER